MPPISRRRAGSSEGVVGHAGSHGRPDADGVAEALAVVRPAGLVHVGEQADEQDGLELVHGRTG